jgi:hypothetical protein
MQALLAGVGVLGVVFAIGAMAALWRGWVLATIWGWFLVPMGAPALGVLSAIAIALIAGFLTHQPDTSAQAEDRGTGYTIMYAIMHPLITLIVAFVLKLFM